MMSPHTCTDIYNSSCALVGKNEHRPSIETASTTDLNQLTKFSEMVAPKHMSYSEKLLSDSTLAIIDDGCEDDVELASDDELIALLSSRKDCFSGAQGESSQRSKQEPTVSPSKKTLSDCVVSNTSTMVPSSARKIYLENNGAWERCDAGDANPCTNVHNYYDHYSGAYPGGVPDFLRAWGATTQKTVSGPPASQACPSDYSQQHIYEILGPLLSRPQEAHPYCPTSGIHGMERRDSQLEFEERLKKTSERLVELYKEEPAVLATNPGSANHHLMTCKPCVFNQKSTGCSEGHNCNYCHVCSKDIFRLKEATKVKIGKRIKKLSDRDNSKAEQRHLREWMVTLGLQQSDDIFGELNQA